MNGQESKQLVYSLCVLLCLFFVRVYACLSYTYISDYLRQSIEDYACSFLIFQQNESEKSEWMIKSEETIEK